MSEKTPDNPAFVLHRYFINADLTRREFERELGVENDTVTGMSIKGYAFLSLWYAALYVTVEGWEHNGFSDPVVDGLLADEAKVKSLRLYRNSILHFQPAYFPEQKIGFLMGSETAIWVRELHDAIGKSLLQRLRA